MEKNKTGKYFKYAIGEIILVVIGILIALQINNWNEQRKNENIKQVYLKSLIAELKSNMKTYQRLRTRFDERITSFDYLFNIINSKNIDQDSIKNAFNKAETFIGITAINRTAFKELINSTNFKVFEKDLRDKILAYYTNIDIKTKRIDLELELVRNLRLEMYNSLDLAFIYGYKEQESMDIVGWETKSNSTQFIKSTNFFASRKKMLLSSKSWFNELIDESNEMILELEQHF